MSTPAADILDVVLSLPVDQRISLVNEVLASLNPEAPPDIDALWAAEARRRADAIDNGSASVVDGEQAFARLRAKYAG